MIAELVPFSDNAVYRFGVFFNSIADHEEGGFDVVLGEYIKQPLGVGRMRSIIKGERDTPPVRVQSDNILSEGWFKEKVE